MTDEQTFELLATLSRIAIALEKLSAIQYGSSNGVNDRGNVDKYVEHLFGEE